MNISTSDRASEPPSKGQALLLENVVCQHEPPAQTVSAIPVGLSHPSLLPVTLADRPLFEAALRNCAEPISDMSFAASLCWADPLALSRAVLADHLCLFSATDGDLSMMLPPLPLDPLTPPSRLAEALDAAFAIMDEINAAGQGTERSRIEYVSDERLDEIRAISSTALSASPMPGDYVYKRTDLVELAGGPLKNKRKSRSRFLRENPGITTGDITRADVKDCLALLERWRHHADVKHEGEANERLVGVDLLRLRDDACTRRYLEMIPVLGLPSMTLRVGGTLVGFTIGEFITPRMAVVAVEKTHPDYDGAPQFIYSEFCRTRLAAATEINAGDDWGIASLRFAKQSYRPSRMLNKSVLTRQPVIATAAPEPATVRALAHGRPAPTSAEPSARTDSVHVRRATADDANAIMRVECAAFPEEDDRFTVRQVRRLIANPRARVGAAVIGEQIVGWSVALIRAHAHSRSGRVYSVAVMPGHEGRGIGRALLRFALDRLREEHIPRVYLEVREHNDHAIALYRSEGFEPVKRLPDYYGNGRHGLRMRTVLESSAIA